MFGFARQEDAVLNSYFHFLTMTPILHQSIYACFSNTAIVLTLVLFLFQKLWWQKYIWEREPMPFPTPQHYTINDIYNLPEGHRAELINGQIYDMAPPSTAHQRILSFLHLEIGSYIREHISVICDPDKIDDKGCHGSPDWIIEIVSPSSKRMDYYTKLTLYRANGVREYWIVDPLRKTIVVYDTANDDGPILYSLTDTIKAKIYDDLKIDFSKLHI